MTGADGRRLLLRNDGGSTVVRRLRNRGGRVSSDVVASLSRLTFRSSEERVDPDVSVSMRLSRRRTSDEGVVRSSTVVESGGGVSVSIEGVLQNRKSGNNRVKGEKRKGRTTASSSRRSVFASCSTISSRRSARVQSS
jgi:hypothetical protein